MAEVFVHHGDNRQVLKGLADASVDAVVTDAPYGLSAPPDRAALVEILQAWMVGRDAPVRGAGFMGRRWDAFVPGPLVWRECYRVLKPGGHLIAFFGTRTYDLGVTAIRLGGDFEVRDLIAWLYGSGFPKSADVSKAIDKAAGAERPVIGRAVGRAASHRTDMRGGRFVGSADRTLDLSAITGPATLESAAWEGWGTALKPALEPVVVARKPLIGTVAANVLAHGTGALNVDGCRVPTDETLQGSRNPSSNTGNILGVDKGGTYVQNAQGRWPANIVHDGSDEVERAFPAASGQKAQVTGLEPSAASGDVWNPRERLASAPPRGDSGSAARFFYSAKADGQDRLGSDHPTIKPIDLMAWLIRLVTPPGGTVLDPFAGSGTTGIAALREGVSAILIEQDARHVADIRLRLDHAAGTAPHTATLKARNKKPKPAGPLFEDDA